MLSTPRLLCYFGYSGPNHVNTLARLAWHGLAGFYAEDEGRQKHPGWVIDASLDEEEEELVRTSPGLSSWSVYLDAGKIRMDYSRHGWLLVFKP